MIRHLTPADYIRMPWANGRGSTVELLRHDGMGGLLWRLSLASVVEDGPFSLFPGIERSLTVISGPGFALHGPGVDLRAAHLCPVAFAGDVPVQAIGVTAPSEDFNVMTARHLPRPEVSVLAGQSSMPAGGLLALFALDLAQINGALRTPHDLVLTDEAAEVTGPVISVRLWTDDQTQSGKITGRLPSNG